MTPQRHEPTDSAGERSSTESTHAWPPVAFDEFPWSVSEDIAHRIGSVETSRISRPYRAASPPFIADEDAWRALDRETLEAAEEGAALVRDFDAAMSSLPVPMPAVLLRSESASSSQIENLTASARNIAAATIGADDKENSAVVAANVAAMQEALSRPGEPDVSTILAIHRTLLEPSASEIAGRFRTKQVWIGASALSPHGASFVAPHPSRVSPLMRDLEGFIRRRDMPPLVHAALVHAQFETIHPFVDGNGRTGRVLVHSMLRRSLPIISTTVPVSAGLLGDTRSYFGALDAYREGDPTRIITELAMGARQAAANGRELAQEVTGIREDWMGTIKGRSDSAAWHLADHLFTQPVVNAAYVARALGVSDRGGRNAIGKLVEAGILRQTVLGRRRNVVWQSDAVVAAMDAFARRALRRQ